MKKPLLLAALALPLVIAGCSHPAPYYPPPPPAYSEVARHGFNDGSRAAAHDMHDGLRPDFERHVRFRNPPVPPPAWEEYRHAFRDGYEQTIHHGPPPGY